LLVCLIGAEFLVIGALDLLFVVMAVDVLDAGAAWAGYLNTAYGAGALVFGALAALLIGRRLGPVVLATAVVTGLALAAATVSGLVAVMVLLAVVGGARALLDVSVRVLLQRTVPPHRLAGVFGVAEGLLMIGLAAGSLLVPFLMSLGGATLALLGTAAILPALVLIFLPLLLRLDQHARVPVVEISLLRQLPLFAQLPAKSLAAVAQRLERVELEPGAALVREGEIGKHYYAIADGHVTVLQRGRPIARLGRADGLGEIALMRSVPRTATAVAETWVLAYRLDRDAFMEAVTGHRAVFELAEAIVRGHADRDAARDHPPTGDPGPGST
jgi:MFS family permease